MVKLPTSGAKVGKVCILTVGATDVIVDVVGHVPTVADYQALTPARILDTRPGSETSDGQGVGGGVRPAGGVLELPVAGRGGVPDGASTAVVNPTVTDALDGGFVTAWPCDAPQPLASTLNHAPGQTIANETFVRLATAGPKAGRVCLFTSGRTQLIADVVGTLP